MPTHTPKSIADHLARSGGVLPSDLDLYRSVSTTAKGTDDRRRTIEEAINVRFGIESYIIDRATRETLISADESPSGLRFKDGTALTHLSYFGNGPNDDLIEAFGYTTFTEAIRMVGRRLVQNPNSRRTMEVLTALHTIDEPALRGRGIFSIDLPPAMCSDLSDKGLLYTLEEHVITGAENLPMFVGSFMGYAPVVYADEISGMTRQARNQFLKEVIASA